MIEEIRRVGKDRAEGMTLDSPIVETGMDSLERMEIVASLEEKFGGRFPEEVLPELETTRQLVAAVETYLGTQPRPASVRPAGVEIPEAAYCFGQFPEYVKLRENLDMLDAIGLGNPFFVVHDGPVQDRTIIGDREYISFSSYNYLGMSGDPAVGAAAKAAIDRYGTSGSASRLVSGQKPIHVEVEREMTRFLGTEDTIALVGGHATNETVIGHLVKPGDLILHDALAHNSITQGCLLSGARRRAFAHNDWHAADRLLEQFRHEYRRVLIVIEGVYSMDGDIPDLPAFIEVKKRHQALLMIDEAHSMGVLGSTGRGIAEHFGVDRQDVDISDGDVQQEFRQLRGLYRRLQGVGRVSAIYGAGIRVRRGHAAPGRGRRLGLVAVTGGRAGAGGPFAGELPTVSRTGAGLRVKHRHEQGLADRAGDIGQFDPLFGTVEGDVGAGSERAADPPSGRRRKGVAAAIFYYGPAQRAAASLYDSGDGGRVGEDRFRLSGPRRKRGHGGRLNR